MASPQIEEGYTAIANEILEHLYCRYLPPNQWQILLCILRKTYGYHKKFDYITNSQIIESTHLGKTVVSRALKSLKDANIIFRDGKNIGLQKDWEQWKKLAVQLTKVSCAANKSYQSSQLSPSKKLADTQQKLADTQLQLAEQLTKVDCSANHKRKKETYTKETIQKQYKGINGEINFVLPEWINPELWFAFMEVRKAKKAPNTEYAKKLLVNEIKKLQEFGANPNEIINQSILRGWTGVFPLKDNNGHNGNGYNQAGPMPQSAINRKHNAMEGVTIDHG